MNKVFLIGTIIEKVEFNFIYKGKYISKAKTKMELKNNSIIEIVGYDKIADTMYKYLQINTIIYLQGKIINEKIEIEKIEKILKNRNIIKVEFY